MNSEFSFFLIGCYSKVKEPNMLFSLLIGRGIITRFISFPRAAVICGILEIQIYPFFSGARGNNLIDK